MGNGFCHDSRSNDYRRPYGAVPCGTTVNLYLEANTLSLPESVRLRAWSKAAGEKFFEPVTVDETPCCFRYRFDLTVPDEPGLVWYRFLIRHENRSIGYGAPGDGLGGEGVEYGAVPEDDWQITVYDPAATVPSWYTNGVMYQIFPDRFYRGDQPAAVPELPPGSLYHPHWRDRPFYAQDLRTGDIAAYDFFGGTLDGIVDKLAYLKSLGITILYLNPIFTAVSNHKYDTGNYLTVDAQFGGDAAFERLRRAAAAAGIRLILDGVFSHTGSESVYFEDARRSQDSPYFPWYRFLEYPNRYDCWWGVTTLPNVNELEPSYREFIINGPDSVVKHWLRKGAAGWRLDVVDELPEEFVQEMYRELKREDPEGVLIGEVWEDASRKVSYGVMREYLLGRELDSVINYPFRAAVVDFLAGRCDAELALRRLASLSENYPPVYFYSTMNVLGTHDVPRVLTLLGDAPPAEGMTKLEQARFQLAPAVRETAVARLKLAALIQFTFPGVPCVYYGDEAGAEGHSDPQNRRPFPWGDENRELTKWYQALAELRQSEPVLRTGRWVPLSAGPDVFAFGRRTDAGRDGLGEIHTDTAALVFVNRTPRMVDWLIDVSAVCAGPLREIFGPGRELHFPDEKGLLPVTLAPYSSQILKATVHPVFADRRAGILLHPTSLPGPYGVGDFGPAAYGFVDWLAAAGQSFWQILPLTPVDATGSPYQSSSAFAGNPLLISPEALLAEGLLSACVPPAGLYAEKVEYGSITAWKTGLLRVAYAKFQQQPVPAAYREFCREAADWLENYALFMALKEHHGGAVWTDWEEGAARRDPASLQRYRLELADEIEFHRFVQYIFSTQWTALRRYAAAKGIRIVGDLPIFVAHDSADVWALPELFALDRHGRPKTRAGVPPDYFSRTGQLWGNPHYNWERHRADDYAWWVQRLRWLFRLVDVVRIDHFRGFEAFWEIPARAKTAVGGRWVKGPDRHFFDALVRQLGETAILAEDLGVITAEVVKLKEAYFFPGMMIMPFEIWPEQNGNGGFHLPAPQPNTFFYTGTHDNDTLVGWLEQMRIEQPELYAGALAYAQAAAPVAAPELARMLVVRVLASEARTAVIPLQDWLGLGTEARMNLPATAEGNWAWRLAGGELTAALAAEIRRLVQSARRL
jgi:4-alpha-glucanotransferase